MKKGRKKNTRILYKYISFYNNKQTANSAKTEEKNMKCRTQKEENTQNEFEFRKKNMTLLRKSFSFFRVSVAFIVGVVWMLFFQKKGTERQTNN